jgi:hypothetical protein
MKLIPKKKRGPKPSIYKKVQVQIHLEPEVLAWIDRNKTRGRGTLIETLVKNEILRRAEK